MISHRHETFRRQNELTAQRARRGGKAYRFGFWAELVCLFLLEMKGYRLISRRLRTPAGEIDLVMRQGQTLVLVEVKARKDMTSAAEAFPASQQRRQLRAAAFVLARYPAFHDKTLRFDFMYVAPWHWPSHHIGAWDASR